MKYVSLEQISRKSAEVLLNSSDTKVVARTLAQAVNHIDDYDWLCEICDKFLDHEDYWVVLNAIKGLGVIARCYGELDLEAFDIKLKKLEMSETFKGIIESTRGDFQVFL
jgi:hypothetical protein